MKNIKKYPLLILTYQRPKHLQQVILALQKEEFTKGCDVYFFIDGLGVNPSKSQVENTKKILKMIEDFSLSHPLVHIYKSPHNRGVFKSVMWATRTVLKSHNAFIYLEEDIVPKPGFIEYMNKSLHYYEDKPEIYAVNGYAFAEAENIVQKESYTAYRFCPWGFATWKDRWESVEFNLKAIRFKKWNPLFWWKFNRDTWGWGWTFFVYTFFPFLRKKIQPWDILFCNHFYLQNKASVWLKYSLVINSGLDGSGLHGSVEFKQNYDNVQGEKLTDACFLEEMGVNLEQNIKIGYQIAPLFRAKSFKTAVRLFRK